MISHWRKFAWQVLPLSVGLLCAAALAGQPEEPLAERPPPGHTRSLSVPQTEVPPKIDGVLDDEAWKGATTADRFWISEQQRWPSEQTEVLVTADATHLYFAFRVFDRAQDQIQALKTVRDSGLGLDDQVVVELDPFVSHREVSSYSVSAAGTQDDAIAGGRARQQSWKGDWTAAATRTAYGWSAEIAIPFSILNYEDGTTTFGVNFLRYHNRTAEWSRWADVTVQFLPEERGRLTGLILSGSVQTRPLTFLPFVLVGRDIPNKKGNIEHTVVTGGVDIRYQPRPNLTGVLSLNPDFSQVESAITDINFNYNKKFLADNRPFFQEGSAYFGKNTSYFYSNNVPNFDYGAKLFTRTAGYQLGALVTRAPEARTDYAINLQREIDPTHKIGGTVVGTDQSTYRNTLAAINAEGRETSGLIYGFDGALTRTDGGPGDGSYVQGTLGWQRDFWTAYLFGSQYTVNFFPADGLLDADLPDTRGVTGYLSYSRDFGVGPIREITGQATWKIRDVGDGRLQRNYAYVGGTIEFMQEVRLGLFWTGGQYRPVGSSPGEWSTTVNHDHYLTASADFNTRSSRLGYGASCSSGSAGGGPYDYCNLYGWTRPTPTTFVNVSLERANSFGRTEQYVVSAGWDITPRHGLYTRYIWSDGSQLRLAYSWHVNERMDFFAVLNTQPGLPTQLSAKVVVTLP